ncbi:MAG: hypothetical protein HY521_05515 [Proteobacteria bacterium]|nr:hypothetical protein [Pseudomonadota bacterium]
MNRPFEQDAPWGRGPYGNVPGETWLTMVDVVSLRLNQSQIAATFDRAFEPERRFDPFYARNSDLNTVTGLLANRLSAAGVLIAQGAQNGADANGTLAKAIEGFDVIEELLGQIEDLAQSAAEDDLSDYDRSLLDQEFRSLRSQIDETAANIEADRVFLLAGIASFSATSVGADLSAANGFAGFTFSNPTNGALADGDVLEVAYSSTTNRFTVTNTTTGVQAVSEAVTTAPAAGQTRAVPIRDLALTITINENFDPGTDIDPAVDAADLTVSGTISARGFDVQVGRDAAAEDTVSLDLEPTFSGVLAAGLRTADLTTAANAASAESDVATAELALAEMSGKVRGARERLVHAADVGFRSANFHRESAETTLFDPDQRRQYHARIADQIKSFVRLQTFEDSLKGRLLDPGLSI